MSDCSFNSKPAAFSTAAEGVKYPQIAPQHSKSPAFAEEGAKSKRNERNERNERSSLTGQLASMRLRCSPAPLQAPPPWPRPRLLLLPHAQLCYSRDAPGRGRFVNNGWFLFSGKVFYGMCA